MPTTTITVASFQAALATAGDAIVARDWATAFGQLALAETINAGLEVVVDGKDTRVARRESLDRTRELLDAARAVVNQYQGSRFVRTRVNASPASPVPRDGL